MHTDFANYHATTTSKDIKIINKFSVLFQEFKNSGQFIQSMNNVSFCYHMFFYFLQLSSTMEQAQRNFSKVPLATDVESAQRLLQQHLDMKNSELFLV